MDCCGLIWARFRAYTTFRSDYAHSEVILRVCRSVDTRSLPEKYRTARATWRLATPQCTVTAFRPERTDSSLLSPNRLARSYIAPQFSVVHNECSSDHYVPKTLGVLCRVLVGRFIDHSCRVEH